MIVGENAFAAKKNVGIEPHNKNDPREGAFFCKLPKTILQQGGCHWQHNNLSPYDI